MAWPESWLGLPGREFQSPHVSHAVTRTVLYCIAQTDGGTPHGMGEMGRRPTSGFPDVIVDHGYATVLYACMLYAGRKRPRRDYASLLRAPFSRTTLQRGRGPVLPHDPSRQIHKRTKPLFPILTYCILAALRGRIGRLSVLSPALLLLTVPFFLLFFSPCIMHHASCIMACMQPPNHATICASTGHSSSHRSL
jgi:hypothetical protein